MPEKTHKVDEESKIWWRMQATRSPRLGGALLQVRSSIQLVRRGEDATVRDRVPGEDPELVART